MFFDPNMDPHMHALLINAYVNIYIRFAHDFRIAPHDDYARDTHTPGSRGLAVALNEYLR